MEHSDFIELCKSGSLQQINDAIKNGADVNKKDEYGDTPFKMAATWNSNPEVLKALIEAGTDVNAKNINEDTPLSLAARNNSNPDVITNLLKYGANAKARNPNGRLPIELARNNKNLKGTEAFWKLNDASY